MPSCVCAGACLCLIAGSISIYSYYFNSSADVLGYNHVKTIETTNCCGCDAAKTDNIEVTDVTAADNSV